MRTPPTALRRAALPLVAAVLLAGCGSEPFQPTHTDAVPLDGGAVGQTFRSASQAVGGVDLLVATYREPPDAGGTLTVRLRHAPGGPVAAQADIGGAALEDNTWVAARFDEPVAVGEQAALEVAWDGDTRLGLRANLPPGEVGTDRLLNDPYPGGELTRQGQPAAGDLAFRVVGAREPLAWLTGLARGAGSRLLRAPVFAAVWVVLLAGAIALAVAGLVRPPRRARPASRGGGGRRRAAPAAGPRAPGARPPRTRG